MDITTLKMLEKLDPFRCKCGAIIKVFKINYYIGRYINFTGKHQQEDGSFPYTDTYALDTNSWKLIIDGKNTTNAEMAFWDKVKKKIK